MGYYRAGFDLIGVDVAPQPDYPFPFVQADALDYLRTADLSGVAAIHASPPCQAYTSTTGNMPNSRDDYPDLVAPTRTALLEAGLPFVIENVEGAPLEIPAKLCGTSFGLGMDYRGPSAPHGWYRLRRHRLFETNWPLFGLTCGPHGRTVGIYGNHPAYERRKYGVGKGQFSRSEKEWIARTALGIDWSWTWHGLKESIPPAYTEFIGRQLDRYLVRYG